MSENYKRYKKLIKNYQKQQVNRVKTSPSYRMNFGDYLVTFHIKKHFLSQGNHTEITLFPTKSYWSNTFF